MRVAGFIRLWPSHRGVGGMQGHGLNLYSALASRGHDVHVFTTNHPDKPEVDIEAGIKVHYLRACEPTIYSKHYLYSAANKLNELHKQKPFDVIHSESDCARRHVGGPIPVTVTWHGIAFCSYRSRLNLAFLDKEKHKYTEELNKTTANILKEMGSIPKYDHSIAISHQAYEDLRTVYNLPAKKVSLVFNGFDPKNFTIDIDGRFRIRRTYKIPDSAIVIGVAGRIVPDKGHRQLIDNLPRLLQRLPSLYVLIVGEGPIQVEYERLKSDRIVFAGAKPYKEMPAYYNAMDLFVNPTTRYLGLDMSIQEAMMCAVPVIASDVGSIKRSLLPDWKYGTTFTLGDRDDMASKIVALIEKKDLKALGAAGREYVKSFCSIENMCEGTEKVFQAAIDSRKSK